MWLVDKLCNKSSSMATSEEVYIAMDEANVTGDTLDFECKLVKALHDRYERTGTKFLNFIRGQLFEIRQHRHLPDKEFVWATSMETGKQGYIPRKSFVEVEYLHHKRCVKLVYFGLSCGSTTMPVFGRSVLPISTPNCESGAPLKINSFWGKLRGNLSCSDNTVEVR